MPAWLPPVVAVLAGILLLASPPPDPDRHDELCIPSTVQFHGDFGFSVNCDSQLFVDAAIRPTLLVTTDHAFQSRPLYFAVPAIVGITGSQAAVFATYQLLNVVLLAAAVSLVGMVASGGQPWWVLVVPLVAFNDVVKAFLWTPHSQLLNVVVPVAALSLLLRTDGALRRGRWHLGVGLLLGFGVLTYGLVVPVAAALTASMLLDDRRRYVGHVAAGTAAPVLAWVGGVRLFRGSFYSHEVVRYEQIVWLTDTTLREAGGRLAEWTAVTAASVAVPAVIAAAGVALAWRHGWRPSGPVVRSVVLLTSAFAGFSWVLGYYRERLSWPIVMPLVALAAIGLSHVRLRRWEAAGYGLAVAGWVAVQVMSAGPWS
jgi:hypothetical protein